MIDEKKSLQNIILNLNHYWSDYGCALLQPYDMEVGAGTFHPATTLRALSKKPWRVAYVQPSRRPTDGRYGNNPNRLQHYYQYQVLIKPSPKDSVNLFLGSLKAIGIDQEKNDLRLVEDDWKSPTLGAAGLGWEIWCDGMEVAQFTYFQQVGGIECFEPATELTYGLERLAMFVQGIDNVYDLNFGGGFKYGDIYLKAEQEFSAYNFEYANKTDLADFFEKYQNEARALIANGLVLPAYDQCLKSSHIFNLMQARGMISVSAREKYIARIRDIVKLCCEAFVKQEGENG